MQYVRLSGEDPKDPKRTRGAFFPGKQGETDVDRVAGCSGRIMEEILAFRKDVWESSCAVWDFISEIYLHPGCL